MSVVTNVILTCSVDEEEAIQSLAAKLQAFSWGKGRPLRDVTESDWIAGEKAVEASILIGAFNFFDQREFMTAVRTSPFKHPNQVQVFLRYQGDAEFQECHVLRY